MSENDHEKISPNPDTQPVSVGGGSKKFIATFIILGVWSTIFSIIWLSGPIYKAASELTSALSELLAVRPSTITVGIVLSTYITLAILVALNPRFNSLLRSLAKGVIKNERSFHLTGDTALSGSNINSLIKARYNSAQFADFRRLLEERIANVESKTSHPVEVQVGEEDWAAIRSQAIDLATERLSEDVRDGVKSSIGQKRVLELEKASLARMSDQIVVLGSRANIALFVGIFFCLSGLVILWSTLTNIEISVPSTEIGSIYWAEFMKVMAPRLSMVLIVEVIGFFFLKLFRAALDEVRLTQNEITNVEMKLIASNLAISECPSDLPKVIHELAATERNMIIEKGQTTVELEKARGVREVEGRYVASLLSLIKGRK